MMKGTSSWLARHSYSRIVIIRINLLNHFLSFLSFFLPLSIFITLANYYFMVSYVSTDVFETQNTSKRMQLLLSIFHSNQLTVYSRSFSIVT